MTSLAGTLRRSRLDGYFRFTENGTTLWRDTVAGATTFVVMSYIIFVNPAILSFAGVEGLEGSGLPFDGVLASTCLVAGVMTILMGLVTTAPMRSRPASA
jgi:adenine/guanine/hypoxanthine permease